MQVSPGENVVALVPAVTLFLTAHATASAKSAPFETSLNVPEISVHGEFAFFHRYSTVDDLVQGVLPSNLLPETIPLPYAHIAAS